MLEPVLYAVGLELAHTRKSACLMDCHGNPPDLESGRSDVVIERLYTDKVSSMGCIVFPPFGKKETCSTDYHDMVRVE